MCSVASGSLWRSLVGGGGVQLLVQLIMGPSALRTYIPTSNTNNRIFARHSLSYHTHHNLRMQQRKVDTDK